MIAQSMTETDIAEQLNVDQSTISKHRTQCIASDIWLASMFQNLRVLFACRCRKV
jgi:hypothetical protein